MAPGNGSTSTRQRVKKDSDVKLAEASSETHVSQSRKSLIMIKKNGEVYQAEEYDAIDVLNPNIDLLTP